MSPSLLAVFVVSDLLWFAAGWLAHTRSVRHPYRWRCPDCPATASSNDVAVVDRIATKHRRTHSTAREEQP